MSHGILHLHYKTQSGFLKKEKKVVLLEGLTTVVTVSSTEALCRSSFELIVVSCFSGRRNGPSARGPCHILQPLCVFYRASCLNPPTVPENATMRPSSSDCLLRDIKAKRPVHPRRSCGPKEQQEEKLL